MGRGERSGCATVGFIAACLFENLCHRRLDRIPQLKYTAVLSASQHQSLPFKRPTLPSPRKPTGGRPVRGVAYDYLGEKVHQALQLDSTLRSGRKALRTAAGGGTGRIPIDLARFPGFSYNPGRFFDEPPQVDKRIMIETALASGSGPKHTECGRPAVGRRGVFVERNPVGIGVTGREPTRFDTTRALQVSLNARQPAGR